MTPGITTTQRAIRHLRSQNRISAWQINAGDDSNSYPQADADGGREAVEIFVGRIAGIYADVGRIE